ADLCAGLFKFLGNGLSNALGATGDHGDFPFKHGLNSSFLHNAAFSSLYRRKAQKTRGSCDCSIPWCDGYLQASLVGLDHLLDHLAADRAGFAGGEVAVVALLEVNANFLWCTYIIKILGQHRTIWQEHSAKDFASYESYKRAGILYVFPPFITARMR